MPHVALNPDTPPFQVPTSTLYIGTSKNVLLQTAQVILYNPKKAKLDLKVRAVLDTGSQRSYATDTVKKALNLESKEVQRLQLQPLGVPPKTFGDMVSYRLG